MPFSFFRSSSIFLLCASSMFASPKIVIEKTTFQCGTVIEGKTDKIHAQFIVKNAGDSVLKINVRPGCGCTVVKYDSLIQPGKTTNIESEVTIKGYHSGVLSKSLTVSSNDSAKLTMRLEIQAMIQGVIDVSDQNINFFASRMDSIYKVRLTTKKKDLKVTEVSFKANENGKGPEWQNNLPFSITFKWVAAGSANADGTWSGTLELYPKKLDKSTYGQIIVKTNHPDKPEVILQGNFMN